MPTIVVGRIASFNMVVLHARNEASPADHLASLNNMVEQSSGKNRVVLSDSFGMAGAVLLP
jgi:hypothetical protein